MGNLSLYLNTNTTKKNPHTTPQFDIETYIQTVHLKPSKQFKTISHELELVGINAEIEHKIAPSSVQQAA